MEPIAEGKKEAQRGPEEQEEDTGSWVLRLYRAGWWAQERGLGPFTGVAVASSPSS